MKIKKQLALGLCFVMAAPMSALAGEISEEDKLKTYDPVITLTFAKPEVVKTYAEGEDAQNNSGRSDGNPCRKSDFSTVWVNDRKITIGNWK